ncbi:MAG: DUF3455 domain-containing protein [Afipia sp.]|nr:DUF3455 domain-containing protein [Afipia sp.]
MPDAIAASGEDIVLTLHAEGAQIYEWRPDASGEPGWVLREPTATLMLDGKTVGRHYAGPNWEHHDGSAIVGKAIANAPATTADDIPWLKIEVVSKCGSGVLSNVTAVQRINTIGGKPDKLHGKPGAFLNVPYSADYVFLKKK